MKSPFRFLLAAALVAVASVARAANAPAQPVIYNPNTKAIADSLVIGPGKSITVSGGTVSGFGGEWGTITGSLSAQTDLSTALGLKANTAALAAVAFSGAYSALSGKPTLGTAAAFDVPASGNAASSEVVKGSDTR